MEFTTPRPKIMSAGWARAVDRLGAHRRLMADRIGIPERRREIARIRAERWQRRHNGRVESGTAGGETPPRHILAMMAEAMS